MKEGKQMIESIKKVNDLVSASKLPACDFVINPYVGCFHACKYCYASFMKRFTGHQEEWGTFIDVKQCDKPISAKKLKGKHVFMASVTDCYNPVEEKYQVTRRLLEQLVDVECYLSISTKSALIVRDLDLLKQMKHLSVAFSINTVDEDFRADMDQASSIEERIEAMKQLHEAGIYTTLFMSPIFPYITDFRQIIEKTRAYAEEYWFENLNLRANYKKTILDYVHEKYPQYEEGYKQIYLRKDRSYWIELGKAIEEYCTHEGIKYENYFYHEEIRKA